MTFCFQTKVGDPTQSLHISSHYSVIDFDGQEEFNVFFSSKNFYT